MRDYYGLAILITLCFLMCGCVNGPVCKVDFTKTDKRIGGVKTTAQGSSLVYLEISKKEIARAKKDAKKGKCVRARGWSRRAAIDAVLAAKLAKIEKLKAQIKNLGGNS